MSRCFPYPPPGFVVGKSTSDEALILPIKNEKVKAITDKKKDKQLDSKDKKRERKEKKREKEKTKGTLNENGKRKLSGDEDIPLPVGKCGKWAEDGNPRVKQVVTSLEQLEKSSLTEEHGNPCCSSDSTGNSSKRKRNASAAPNPPSSGSGTVIRFKFTSQKKENPLALVPTPSTTSSIPGRQTIVPKKSELKLDSSSLPATPSSSSRLPTKPQKLTAKHLQQSACGKEPAISQNDVAGVNSLQIHAKVRNQSTSGGVGDQSTNKSHIRNQSTSGGVGDQSTNKSHIPSTPPCSTSGRSIGVPQKCEPRTNNSQPPAVPSRFGKAASEPKVNSLDLPAKILSTSGKAVVVQKVANSSQGVSKTSPSPSVVVPLVPIVEKKEKEKKAPRALRKLVKLMDSWVPPAPVQELTDDLDDDWLFGGEKVAKRSKSCKEESATCEVSFPLQPRAQYLSDVEVYALPFTVPF